MESPVKARFQIVPATRITTLNYLVSPVLIESSLSWKATETSPSSWNFGSLTVVRLFNQADELKCLDIRGLVWTLNLDLCLIFQQALTATCMKCPLTTWIKRGVKYVPVTIAGATLGNHHLITVPLYALKPHWLLRKVAMFKLRD